MRQWNWISFITLNTRPPIRSVECCENDALNGQITNVLVLCRPQKRGQRSAGQLAKKKERDEVVGKWERNGHWERVREGDAQLRGCLHFSGSCICARGSLTIEEERNTKTPSVATTKTEGEKQSRSDESASERESDWPSVLLAHCPALSGAPVSH